MKRLRLRWLVLLFALCFGAPSLPAAEGTKPGILFLRLRLKDGAFSLVSATNVPGVLKAPRGTKASKDFHLVVETGQGIAIWNEEIADPSVERLEFADPVRPGVIQVKEVRRPDVEFTVRVPAASGQQGLAIYRRAVGNADAREKPEPPRDLVARILLPNPAPP